MSKLEIAAQHGLDEMATDLTYALHRITADASPAVLRLYSGIPNQLKRDLMAQVIRSMRDTTRGNVRGNVA